MKLLFLQYYTSPLIPKVTCKCFYTKYYPNELLKTRKKRYQKSKTNFIQLPMKKLRLIIFYCCSFVYFSLLGRLICKHWKSLNPKTNLTCSDISVYTTEKEANNENVRFESTRKSFVIKGRFQVDGRNISILGAISLCEVSL